LPHQVLDEIGVGEFDFDSTAPLPVLADGIVYVGSGDGGFHAVVAEGGKQLWRFANDDGKAEDLGVPWTSKARARIAPKPCSTGRG
jgi:outer membrane protein assembly factor BamB